MVKANDDCRQEVLAMQLITRVKQIWDGAGSKLWLRPYNIFITSSDSAIMEFIPDSVSIHGLKKQIANNQKMTGKLTGLKQFYLWYYGPKFEEARMNFLHSLAAYSVFCYVFSVKDRHNGNILLTRQGHLLHIDFGFFLQNSPGKVIETEKAPFKLTSDYIDMLDGQGSPKFQLFKELVHQGLTEVKRNIKELLNLILILSKGKLCCLIIFRVPNALLCKS